MRVCGVGGDDSEYEYDSIESSVDNFRLSIVTAGLSKRFGVGGVDGIDFDAVEFNTDSVGIFFEVDDLLLAVCDVLLGVGGTGLPLIDEASESISSRVEFMSLGVGIELLDDLLDKIGLSFR